VYTGNGMLVNSGDFDGTFSQDAKEKITQHVGGEMTKTYKLRDWIVSRQRYWGVPIPLVFCESCEAKEKKDGKKVNPGWFAEQDDQLPVELPDVEDYLPSGDGRSPLAKVDDFVKTTCPQCGGEAVRETDTFDTFIDSSWYFLRYADAQNTKVFADPEKLKSWMPVDLYSGGAEHTTMHVLYSRFWHKALFDLGLTHEKEPYVHRMNRGLILGPDGNKMSKSKGNVIDPDDVVEQIGADTLRLYLAFIGPYNEVGAYPWSTEGIVGMRRFLEKVWRLCERCDEKVEVSDSETIMHQTIKKVTEDITALKFNTAVAQLMIFVKELEKQEKISVQSYETLITLLSPFTPHFCEELWEKLDHKESIFGEQWPEYDEGKLAKDEIELVVQVNGKVRDKISVGAAVSEEEAFVIAQKSDKVAKFVDKEKVKKVIFVPGRLLNIVC